MVQRERYTNSQGQMFGSISLQIPQVRVNTWFEKRFYVLSDLMSSRFFFFLSIFNKMITVIRG